MSTFRTKLKTHFLLLHNRDEHLPRLCTVLTFSWHYRRESF